MQDAKHNPSEVNKRILRQIEQTCVMMIQQNKGFRKTIAQQVHAFAFPPKGTSTRTADVVKAVKVLGAQFSCLLKAANLKEALSEVDEEVSSIFLDPKMLAIMKQKFVRHGVEEQMRRMLDEN